MVPVQASAELKPLNNQQLSKQARKTFTCVQALAGGSHPLCHLTVIFGICDIESR